MKVLAAIASLGGEGSGYQIHQKLCYPSKWALFFGPSYGSMYNALDQLEKNGQLTSRWGEATLERGWRRPRIYTIAQPKE